MKKIFVILFACLSLSAFGQELEPITTTNLRVIINRINTLQGLVGTGGVSEQWVRGEINDSIVGRISKGIDLDTELAGYATQNQLSGREPALGNPAQNGHILYSTTEGVRTWGAPPEGGGSSYDDTAINSRIDSLVAAVKVINEGIEDLWTVIGQLGELDLVAPKFVSAEVGATGDDKVIITMDESLNDQIVPSVTAFAFSDGNGGISITDVDIKDEYITLTLDEDAEYGETYTISYTRPETNPLQDEAGNPASSWANRAVTNNVQEPGKVKYNVSFAGYTNGNLDGQSHWTQVEEHIRIRNGQAEPYGELDNISAYYAQPLGNNQYAEIIITSNSEEEPLNSLGPAVRMSSGNYYAFIASHEDLAVIRVISGSSTVLNRPTGSVDEGDVVRIEISGNTITCLINSTVMWSDTDNSLSSGYAGMAGYAAGIWEPFTSTATWEAGDL